MTFLVTSADSGILVMNTIMSGGDQDIGNKHKVVWGLILTAVVGVLLMQVRTIQGRSDGGTAQRDDHWCPALYHGDGPDVYRPWQALYRDGLREKDAQ